MKTYKIWEDGKEEQASMIEATGMNEALDLAAREMGYYADYADLARERGWDGDEGLNIELV